MKEQNDLGDCAKKRTGLLRWFASLRPKTDPPSAATPIPIAPSRMPEGWCIACHGCMPYLETCAVCGRVNTTEPWITQ